jgi:hypothetical protein
MAQLIDLPTENLTEIVAQVYDSWHGLKDLPALRLTSRKLRDVTDIFFFQNLQIEKSDRGSLAKNFLLFFDIVAQRKDLRKRVKTVDVFL